uniref:MCL1 apoptosis regulator, BCL2 family member n=2 Tax=Salvator merianae TaxID=96440 RepID=A0A8D0E855_SALMN
MPLLNRKAMVLCCGSASGLAPAAPVSPGAGGGGGGGCGGPLTALASPFSAPRIGGFPWPRPGLAEGAPLGLYRPLEGAPRPRAAPPAREGGGGGGGEEELDGFEPEDEAPAGGGPASPASPASEGEDSDSAASSSSSSSSAAAADRHDDLRRVTLELVRRYLHEAAERSDAKPAAAAATAGGGKKLFQGLMGRFGTPSAGAPSALASSSSSPCVAQALETLRRVGDAILDKHQLAFQGMLKKLEIKNEEDLKTVSEVATHVFSDGVTNWGRIVTLISFGAFVAKHLKTINKENGISTLADIITDVLVTDKREWLLNHNAWEGFIKFFHVEDIEGSIRNVLVAFAGVAGVGAGLAYLIRPPELSLSQM